jgi:membrane protein required for colicin V production
VSTTAGWPDIVIVVVLALAVIKGFIRGFVSEVGGVVAVAAAFAAAFYYNGILDDAIAQTFKADRGIAHMLGVVATGVVVYVVILLFFFILRQFTKLPGLGTLNALGGMVAAAMKGVVLLWVALFVALLFPLSHQVRADLRRSQLVEILAHENPQIDSAVLARLPDFAKPYVKPVLAHEVLY